MDFTLHYRGPLKANGRPKEKQLLRRAFQPQLRELWHQQPLKDVRKFLDTKYELNVLKRSGDFTFAPLVSSRHNLVAKLELTMLRPEEPGHLVTSGGDIDNRLKTLLDALSVPKANQIPEGDKPGTDEDPFHCLLEDDNLITNLSADVDRLLAPENQSEVIIILNVSVRTTRATLQNVGMAL